MAYYGQRIYNQELGNGRYTIAEAGCLLVSFCNLRVKLGLSPVDPPSLNQWFKDHNIYLRDPADSALEDLAYSSITSASSQIRVSSVGVSPMPPDSLAIVKFHYQSTSVPIVNGRANMIDHFCLVDRIEGDQMFIVDSWDGFIKGPTIYEGRYGKPIGWAVYTTQAAPVAPARSGPIAPIPFPGNPDDTYTVSVPVAGYRTSGQAATRSGAVATVQPGQYFVYNRSNNMVNVTKKVGSPGSWINPGDNVAPAPPSQDPATFNVTATIPGYMTSNDAANHLNSPVDVAPGTYFVFNTSHGMVNVTKKLSIPGSWINPNDLNKPKPAVTMPVTPAAPVQAAVAAIISPPAQPAAPHWSTTYRPQPDTYIATKTILISDLSGQKKPVPMHQYDEVKLAGTFTGPDGVLYGRTLTSVKYGWWYAIPMNALELESNTFSTATDTATRFAVGLPKVYDYIVKLIGTPMVALFERFGWVPQTTNAKEKNK